MDAVNEREPVLVTDVREREMQARRPLFATLSYTASVRAVFAFPLLADSVCVGVLGLCHDRPRMLDDAEEAWARHFSGAALALLLSMITTGGDGEVLVVQTLGSEIHQASGVVAVQLDCRVEQALLRLRAHALATDEPLTQVAHRVVTHSLRFSPSEG